jgi:hypothetical protein
VILAAIFYQLGIFTLFVLGSLTSWRSAAGIVAVIPLVTLLMLSRVSDERIQYTIMPSELLTLYVLELLSRKEILMFLIYRSFATTVSQLKIRDFSGEIFKGFEVL